MKNKLLTLSLMLFLLLTSCFSFFIKAESVKTLNYQYTNDLFANKSICLSDLIDKMATGDIIIHLAGNEKQNGHCRILTNITNSYSKFTFVDTYYHVLSYSCNKLKLKIILLFISYIWGYDGVTLLRVNASAEQKQNAVDFAKLQVGKLFDGYFSRGRKNYNPEDKTDYNANQWYCSELPWASYYNCNNSFPGEEPEGGYIYGEGIDIDANEWEMDCIGFLGNEYALVYPRDIINDDDIELITSWIRPDREHKYI